jgi:hypothetical protein
LIGDRSSLRLRGTKHIPIHRYPLLAECLAPLVREHGGRLVPTVASALAMSDDTAITSLRVTRVRHGEDFMHLNVPVLPDIEGWLPVEVRYFGTIGSSVQAAQTRALFAEIRLRTGMLREAVKAASLRIHFQLSSNRRDRDLDNLGDALMPLFNGWFPGLADLHSSKGPRQPGETERM